MRCGTLYLEVNDIMKCWISKSINILKGSVSAPEPKQCIIKRFVRLHKGLNQMEKTTFCKASTMYQFMFNKSFNYIVSNASPKGTLCGCTLAYKSNAH